MKAEYDFSRGKRGPVLKAPPGKTRITIRLDDDLLDWFRKQAHAAGGASYQTLINAALRDCTLARSASRWRRRSGACCARNCLVRQDVEGAGPSPIATREPCAKRCK